MKSITFNDNTHIVETRDIIELIGCISNDSRFDKKDIHISYNNTILEDNKSLMITVLFNIQTHKKNSKTKKMEYENFLYRNYRAKSFACQNKSFELKN